MLEYNWYFMVFVSNVFDGSSLVLILWEATTVVVVVKAEFMVVLNQLVIVEYPNYITDKSGLNVCIFTIRKHIYDHYN